VPTDDGVAVGTLSQGEEGRELLRTATKWKGLDAAVAADISEETKFEFTKVTPSWVTGPRQIGGLMRHPLGACFAAKTIALKWALRASLAARLFPVDAQASRSQPKSLA
jgi:hypothetical protein